MKTTPLREDRAYINALPVEILRIIFSKLGLAKDSVWPGVKPFSLALVCRRWRGVALTDKMPWSNIKLSWEVRLIKWAAERAAPNLLMVRPGAEGSVLDKDRRDLVNGLLSRVEIMHLALPPSNQGDNSKLLNGLSSTAQALQVLELMANGSYRRFWPPTLGIQDNNKDEMNLHTLVLDGLWFSQWPIWAQNIRTFRVRSMSVGPEQLGMPLSSFVTAFLNMPRLECVDIRNINPGDTSTLTSPQPTFIFDALTDLLLLGDDAMVAAIRAWLTPNAPNLIHDGVVAIGTMTIP
ncbi:hypothetical protein FA95DRAFT_1609679 [Auriscalpium vulgare]|uniref:Uncharacterized protein n=1 Tax=Auriscalpium vulgare TaxID=40419 RepID=A0ACB8RHV4_9AGAM|nr:hypothetical protein FA95DRAFT_1609679 [Auriscalpium vulgare]